ncbi:MAG: hypothetical protein QHC90_29135 [Shinella sp.]|nr:hypothetical protein [Shinella sp.]
MEDDRRNTGEIPANDNSREPGEAEDGEDKAPSLDRVVFDIARLIGRQMAREDFERLLAASANDNAPRKEADKD